VLDTWSGSRRSREERLDHLHPGHFGLLQYLRCARLQPGQGRYISKLESYLEEDYTLLLSLAVVYETGNHIAHVADGGVRRKVAGQAPWMPTPFPDWAKPEVTASCRLLFAVGMAAPPAACPTSAARWATPPAETVEIGVHPGDAQAARTDTSNAEIGLVIHNISTGKSTWSEKIPVGFAS